MAREPTYRGEETSDGDDCGDVGMRFEPDDKRFDNALRPQRLAEVVGQTKAVERLRIMIDAALMAGILASPPTIARPSIWRP